MHWTSISLSIPSVLQQIQPFMFSVLDRRVICKIGENEINQRVDDFRRGSRREPSTSPTPSTVRALPKLMSVKKTQDPLFWTLFLAKYGETEYRRAFKTLNTEMKEKNIVSDHFHKLGSEKINSDLSKKISKKGCNQIVEDIITQPKLLLSSVYAFCLYYNFNIYIVDTKKKIYLQFLLDKPEQFENVVLYRKHDKIIPEYFMDIPAPSAESQAQTLTKIRETLVGLISFEKSLKGVSTYNLREIYQIYSKLGLDPAVAPSKKNEMYEKIIIHCVWEIGKK